MTGRNLSVSSRRYLFCRTGEEERFARNDLPGRNSVRFINKASVFERFFLRCVVNCWKGDVYMLKKLILMLSGLKEELEYLDGCYAYAMKKKG